MKITRVVTRPVLVPLPRPVHTASGSLPGVPLVLIDLETDDGPVGHSYVFSYYTYALAALDSLVASLGELLYGDELVPVRLNAKLRARVALLGDRNLVGIAISGLDLAAWDVLAKAAGMPLVTFLGGQPTPVRAYDSLGMLSAEEAGERAEASIERGFRAVKVKVGFPSLAEDLAVIRSVRQVGGDELAVMVDYNQCLTVGEAIRRGRALEDEGLAWIEEPVRANDFAGCAEVAATLSTPVSIGENFNGPFEMDQALRAGASDAVMPDVAQIGGASGWLRAATLAEAAGKPMSSHLFPEVSAHLLPVTPTCDWLEYLDLAGPVLAEPTRPTGGHLAAADRPGLGLSWDLATLRQLRG